MRRRDLTAALLAALLAAPAAAMAGSDVRLPAADPAAAVAPALSGADAAGIAPALPGGGMEINVHQDFAAFWEGQWPQPQAARTASGVLIGGEIPFAGGSVIVLPPEPDAEGGLRPQQP